MMLRQLWIVLALFLWTAPVQATVFWSEGFEYANAAAMDAVWTSSNPGCNELQPSTDVAHSGTSSLKENLTNGVSTCYQDRNHTSTNSVWTRFYIYLVNFVPQGSVQSKVFYNKGPANSTFSVWVFDAGTVQLYDSTAGNFNTYCPTTNRQDSACNYSPNTGSVILQNNQWYCIETHVNNGTPGGTDGDLELFVNGTQTSNYTGQALLASGAVPGLDHITIYAQYGSGTRYLDDFAVGDTRFNDCASANTTPPAAPTGLKVQ
jgi:hypothetical protein